MAIGVGSIVVPKDEWLDPGESKRPCVVVDIWDDSDVGQKMSVMDCEAVAEYKRGKRAFVPRFDTFVRYYDEVTD